jgi:hypothetical protein
MLTKLPRTRPPIIAVEFRRTGFILFPPVAI